jgi:hypothetical protein
MAKTATKAPPTKAEWLNRVDAAVFKEAPSIESTLRDGAVRDFAREFGVPEPALSQAFWRNEHHLAGIYGPLGPDLRLHARFVGAQTRWDDHAERFYDLTVAGAEQAAREICDLLRLGPSRLTNARENMRDAQHYVREMQHYDRVAAETRPRLNGLNGSGLLDMYRRVQECDRGAPERGEPATRNAPARGLSRPLREVAVAGLGQRPSEPRRPQHHGQHVDRYADRAR